MEVVKKNGEVTQYRSYEWDGYTPIGLIVKEKEASGNYQTKTYQYITNQRGDVLSMRDQEDQEVGSYRYDAYGNVLSVEGDVAKDNPIRYAGYYYDEETQNYYLQARYYNPENGAFLALDPHPGDDDEPLSQNGYTYGNNNPVMHVDPNGNNPIIAGVIIGLLIKQGAKWVTKKFGKKILISLFSRDAINSAKRKTSKFIVSRKHLKYAGGRGRKFSTNSKTTVRKWIKQGLNSNIRTIHINNSNKLSFYMIANMGKRVGTKGERKIKIVFGMDGKIWTAYPVR